MDLFKEQSTLPLEDRELMFSDDQMVRLIVTSNKKRKFTFTPSMKQQVSQVSAKLITDQNYIETEGTITALNDSHIGDGEVVLQIDVIPNDNYWNMYQRKRSLT